jgi:hypothetical protein
MTDEHDKPRNAQGALMDRIQDTTRLYTYFAQVVDRVEQARIWLDETQTWCRQTASSDPPGLPEAIRTLAAVHNIFERIAEETP